MTRSPREESDLFGLHFAPLHDPRRVPGRCTHSLRDLIVMSIVAVVCGADGWEEIAEFSELRAEWFETRLGVQSAPASEATLRRVMTALRPSEFGACFAQWAASLEAPVDGESIAIDGKTLRGGARGGHDALHMVHAWATGRGVLLGQQACANKGNELAAMESLLERLQLRGMVVTIDAAGCQTAIAQQVVDAGGDYALTVKGNQRTLHESIAMRFLDVSRGQPDLLVHEREQIEKGHGRSEERMLWCAAASTIEATGKWPGAQSVIALRRRREQDGVSSEEWRYFISSLPSDDPSRLAHVIRSHWGVENALHWSLDVGFREDQSSLHHERAQENFATLRRFALTLIQKTPRKLGVAASRKKAGWDDTFLLAVLRNGITKD